MRHASRPTIGLWYKCQPNRDENPCHQVHATLILSATASSINVSRMLGWAAAEQPCLTRQHCATGEARLPVCRVRPWDHINDLHLLPMQGRIQRKLYVRIDSPLTTSLTIPLLWAAAIRRQKSQSQPRCNLLPRTSWLILKQGEWTFSVALQLA